MRTIARWEATRKSDWTTTFELCKRDEDGIVSAATYGDVCAALESSGLEMHSKCYAEECAKAHRGYAFGWNVETLD